MESAMLLLDRFFFLKKCLNKKKKIQVHCYSWLCFSTYNDIVGFSKVNYLNKKTLEVEFYNWWWWWRWFIVFVFVLFCFAFENENIWKYLAISI